MTPIIILGSGMAGYTLAREFRKLDTDTPLLIITADDGCNYSKPMLSTGFSKGKSADQLAMQNSQTMAEQLRADILTDTRVIKIETATQTLVLDDGRQLSYSKLVMALGADPVRLQLPGDAADKVLSVNNLQDYRLFRQQLPEQGRVAILGAGLIGCEFANDLRQGGHRVDVIALDKQLMNGLIHQSAAAAVQQALMDEGVNFYLENTISSVNKEGDALQVSLKNGETLQADVVLSAIGLRPNTELADLAGLDTARGIRVNRLLETSAANVFALGDCAEVDGHNLLYVMPLMNCARALAKTLSGSATEVQYGPMPVTVKTPACPLVVAPPAHDIEGEWQLEINDRNIRALFTNQDKLLGFVLTGAAVSEKMTLTRQLPNIF